MNAADKYPFGYDQGFLSTAGHWMRSIELEFRINSDPVLRTIVCRLSFTNFTLTTLVLATGVPRDLVAHAVQELSEMELANWAYDETGKIFIVPASEEARLMMREWANRWCSSDEACAVGS